MVFYLLKLRDEHFDILGPSRTAQQAIAVVEANILWMDLNYGEVCLSFGKFQCFNQSILTARSNANFSNSLRRQEVARITTFKMIHFP